MGESSAEAAARVGAGFSDTVEQYEGAVRYNLDGVRRLVATIPAGDYGDLLDVGCGTGWATIAFAERFGTRSVIGVDPSEGMLEKFTAEVAARGIEAEVHAADVMAMPVPSETADAVISTMAFHWFADKEGAVREMARRLRPGGVFALLAGGEGVENEFRLLMESLDPPVPARWPATYDHAPTSAAQMHDYLAAAGLEPIDVWIERRLRRTPVDDFLERVRVVAGHLNTGLDPVEVAGHRERIREAMVAAADSEGRFEYHFHKLFTLARRPA